MRIIWAVIFVLFVSNSQGYATKANKYQRMLDATLYIGCNESFDLKNKIISSSGSGVRVASTPNWEILTAAHVVESCPSQIIVCDEQNCFEAVISKVDVEKDLALLTTIDIFELPTATALVSAVFPRIGDDIVVIGFPAPYVVETLTKGNVANVKGWQMLVTALCNFGNSGGPVFNERGEIVGIAVAVTHNHLWHMTIVTNSQGLSEFLHGS